MSLEHDFKEALSSWASGVSVVATRVGELAYGLTVSSFTSLSLDPPMILVCVGNRNRLPAMIREARAFTVSLLGADQAEASAFFARSGREPGLTLHPDGEQPTDGGLPAVKDAMAHLSCQLHDTLVVGDHTVCVGRVTDARATSGRKPLVYYRRAYRAIA